MEIKAGLQKHTAQWLDFIQFLGRATILLFEIVKVVPRLVMKPRSIIDYVYMLGFRPMLPIMLIAFFVGALASLQTYTDSDSHLLVDTGALRYLNLLVKEFAPIVTALIFILWVNNVLGDKLVGFSVDNEPSVNNPSLKQLLEEIIAPLFVAGLVAAPLLLCIFDVIGLGVHSLMSIFVWGMDATLVGSLIQTQLDFFDDIAIGIFKSILFALMVMWILTFYTLNSGGSTARDKNLTSSKSLTATIIMILSVDLLLSIVFL